MEKRVVVAIGLSVALYAVYLTYFTPSAPPPARTRTGTVATGTVAKGTVATREPGPHGGEPGARGAGEGAPAAVHAPSPDLTVTNGSVDFVVASRGAGLKAADAWGCRYHERGDRSVRGDPGVTTGWTEDMPGALSLGLVAGGEDVPDLTRVHWAMEPGEDAVTARMEAAGLEIERTVRVSEDPAHPWHANVEYAIRNVSARPGAAWTIEIVGPVLPRATLPNDGIFVAPAGDDDASVDPIHAATIHEDLAENPRLEHQSPSGRWAWIAARSDFYLGALVPTDALPAGTTVGFRKGMHPATDDAPAAPTAAATFRIPFVVPPVGGEERLSFLCFAGPAERTLTEAQDSPYRTLEPAIVQRGWLAPIRGLLAWLLAKLASTGMGYGLAVISLTILVRTVLFPLSRKSQISMRIHAQKMARLKPKMDAIREKHKDPKKQQELTMKLMREEKVSLLPGGCLLAFAQMPIWIALYSVLQTTFEMRHAQFLWVKDLTAPDHLVHLPFAKHWWLVPEWINLLPLLMMVVWYTSAAMQPLPADPQQASQAKMMRWMPVLFGFFLYSTAAGLTLYMTMSALWSIGETWVIRKVWLAKLENALK